MGTAWKGFLAAFVLFLLSCAACHYGLRGSLITIPPEELADDGPVACGVNVRGLDEVDLGAALFLASASVAAGGAMRWWREGVVGEGVVRTPLLDLYGDAAASAGAIEGTQDTSREETPAPPAETKTPPPQYAPPFTNFDEQGLSPLERILAEG